MPAAEDPSPPAETLLPRLLQLWELAGAPSYRDLERLTRQRRYDAVSSSTAQEKLTGRSPLSLEQLLSLVSALLHEARRLQVPVSEDLEDREQWTALWRAEHDRRQADRRAAAPNRSPQAQAVADRLAHHRAALRTAAEANPALVQPEFDSREQATTDTAYFEALLRDLRAMEPGAGQVGALARDPWPGARMFVQCLFARGLLSDDEAKSLLHAAGYRPTGEVHDLAVRLAAVDPELVHDLLYSAGAVRDEATIVDLLTRLLEIPSGVWKGTDVQAALFAGYTMTHRPEDIAALLLLSEIIGPDVVTALAIAAADYLNVDDVVELIRRVAHSEALAVVIILERLFNSAAPEWVDAVLVELDTWDAQGQAAYIRRRRAGDRPTTALTATQHLRWGTTASQASAAPQP